MTLEEAYQALDLPENATLEELEARYYELTEHRTSAERLEEIQNAYNMIRGHIYEVNPPPKDPWFIRMKDYISMRKPYFIFGAIGVIVLISFLVTAINGMIQNREEANNPPDLYVVFFGNFIEEDADSLEVEIKERFPEWENVSVHIEYAPGEEGTELDFGAAQKSQVFLATEKPDIYIFDHHFFDIFNDDTTYIELDGLENATNKLLNDAGQPVGLDVTDHDFFTQTANADKDKLMFVPKSAKQMDHALKFIHLFAE